jgi:hypothetical protein
VIQIDGIHMDEDLILLAAIGVDANGDKHPLGLVEGATENAATTQHSSTISSRAGLIQRYRGYSSSTARRPCPRRSVGLPAPPGGNGRPRFTVNLLNGTGTNSRGRKSASHGCAYVDRRADRTA